MKTSFPNSLRVAFFSLFFGSIATPVIYVATCLILPQSGFEDLRNEPFSTVALAFGTAWLFSALMTCIVGGVFWLPAHAFHYDGFITYLVIATSCSILILVCVEGSVSSSLLMLSMSASNAIAVRLIERFIFASGIK